MGDRGNIVIRQEKDTNRGDVWFYGHWSGYRIKHCVQEALARKVRWDDDPYLARIVFDAFTAGKQGGETGFGISCRMQDNEYPIVVVDVIVQEVYTIAEKDISDDGRVPINGRTKALERWTFDEFVIAKLKEDE